MRPILLPPPENSRLAEWIEDGNRHEPPGSNTVTVTSPDERYALTVERDSREMFRLVAKLGDRLTDLADVFTSLKIKFLNEVVNRLCEIHTGEKSAEPYK